ncbi:hypothetical protein ACTXT7_000057 [Hymenolepis weldensis]
MIEQNRHIISRDLGDERRRMDTVLNDTAMGSTECLVANSAYEDRGSNRRQHVTLMINDKRVKLKLETFSEITLITGKIWRSLGCPVLKPTNHIARESSDDALKLKLHLTVQFVTVISKLPQKCFVTNQSDFGQIEATEPDQPLPCRKIIRDSGDGIKSQFEEGQKAE